MRLPFLFLLLFGACWPLASHANVPAQVTRASDAPTFLLVATHKLAHGWFRETVILVTQHKRRGTVGIVLNRPRNISLDRALPAFPAARNFVLFAGGPLDPHQILYLVRSEEAVKGALKISEHLYISNAMSMLGELLSGGGSYSGLRIVNGYAGWAPGQLENEIARGDWFSLPVDEAAIFDRPASEMWQELHRRVLPLP